MNKFLFFVLVFIIANNTYTQTYFNFRFDYEQTGVWDGATSAIPLPDGYGICGGTGTVGNYFWSRIGLMKIDFNGNKLFTKTYGDTISEYYSGNSGCLIQLNDTSFMAVGSKNTYLSNWVLQEGLLIKFNKFFDTLFCKKYGDIILPVDTAYLFQQIKLTGSNFIITGDKMPYGLSSKAILIKTDNLGNVIFEKSYGAGAYYDGYSVICTTDGGYAVGGFVWAPSPPPNYSGDPIIIKTDSAGNQEWMKNLGGPYPDNVAMLTNSIDGNIIIGTSYCDSIHGDPFRRINLIKIDNSGTILWNKKYGKSEYFKTLVNIRTNIDGSLIATGITNVSKESSSEDLAWILKTTADGDSLWYREYAICDGEDSDNWLMDVIETPDNGYLACGVLYPMPPDTGSQDGWVIKVDSLGCESPEDCWVGMKQEDDILANDQLSIYPNPAREQVNFIIRKTKEEVRIELFDIFGRKVKELKVPEGIERTLLDISNLPDGLYMIRAETRDGLFGKGKLIVE